MPCAVFYIQTVMFHHIFKKIVLQCFGNFHKRVYINTLTVKDFINIGSLAMYPPRKLRYTQSALVKNGFHYVPDVKFVLSFHIVDISQHNIKKAWK